VQVVIDDKVDSQTVIPEAEPPSVDVSESVYREIFMMMRYQLKNDVTFQSNLSILNTLIKNIVNDPTNAKYQKLKLSNEKIRKAIVECEQS
jgi:PUB domain